MHYLMTRHKSVMRSLVTVIKLAHLPLQFIVGGIIISTYTTEDYGKTINRTNERRDTTTS